MYILSILFLFDDYIWKILFISDRVGESNHQLLGYSYH